jgi:glycosyltransferase involved in cell wall biosynthesis
MRILIATGNLALVGGIERYLQALIPRLLDRGHQIALLHEYRLDPKLQSYLPNRSLPAWCAQELGAADALRAVAEWRPGLVYSHGLDAGELEDSILRDYPTVLYAHNYYGTCISGRKCHSFPQSTPCARQFGAACILMYYPRRCGGLNPGSMWKMFRRQSQLNSRLPGYHAVLVASQHMHEEFRRHGVRAENLHLVPLPITDIVPDAVPPARKNPEGRILFMGRLTDVKGADRLIQAMPHAAEKLGRPLTVTICGEGQERSKLEDLAARLGVQAKFTGWIDTSRKVAVIRDADLLVVPSLWPEPFGLVGIEAGCLGLPAAGYAVGGIPDWLSSGRSGELAPGDPPTVDGLANAMVRALADPEHYATLCRGAWEMAARFTLDAHMAKLEPLLSAAEREPAALTPAAIDGIHV